MVRKLEFFDALIVIYLAVFVREYFWILPHNRVAWFLTVVVTLALGAVYLATKETPDEKQPSAFWFIVGLPLLFIYSLRFAYPDLSFDVLNYHIFHSERALHGLLYVPGDFAPAYFPFLNNPAPDMITGLFRRLLGFRLGTIVNYLVLLWTGAIVFKLFRQYVPSNSLRAVAVLVVLFSEQLLFEINNYMVDLLALPLLLQATQLVLKKNASRGEAGQKLIFVSLFLGMSVALKLTNLVFALPIGILALYTLVIAKPVSGPRDFWSPFLALGFFILPNLPYTTYVYSLTGNPMFPLFNKLFKSPYWPVENVLDGRWGARNSMETFLWPFKIWANPERLSELNVYSGRISIGVVAACLLLLLARRDTFMRSLSIITIVGAGLWSAGTGYIRYGLFLEVLGGISALLLGVYFWKSSSRPPALRRAIAVAAWCVLLAQTLVGVNYLLKTEWGGRSIARSDYGEELLALLADRSLRQYLTPDEARLFDGVGAWVDSSYKTSALAVMLKNDVPYVNIFVDAFSATPLAFKKYQAALRIVESKRMLSLAFAEDSNMALSNLDKRGFKALSITPIQFPYYSLKRRLPLVVIEVALKPSAQPVGIFEAQIDVLQDLSHIKVGESATLRVKVKNISAGVWSARGQPDGAHQVKLGNKWLDQSGKIVVNDDGRTSLPRDIGSGEEIELELRVTAPPTPGSYHLMLDLVQENIAWFSEKGSRTATMEVRVEH